jgi:outer membrane lipoprotein carrier protein
MQFRDQLGSTTDIHFSNWQRNPDIPPQDFNFTPPKGTDVVGDLPVITTQPIKN